MSEIGSKMYICLRVMYHLCLSDFNETRTCLTDFRGGKNSHIKFHENPSIRSRVFPYGQTDGRKGMMKLVVAFRNSVNATKNYTFCSHRAFVCFVQGDQTVSVHLTQCIRTIPTKLMIWRWPSQCSRNADRAIPNTVFENRVRRVNKRLETGGGHFEHCL